MKADLKIGDYVRTKYGISKIEKIEDDKTHKTTWYTVDKAQYHSFLVREQEIIKASDKLIDLIDVGDYVNGSEVLDFYIVYDNEKNQFIVKGVVTESCYLEDTNYSWIIEEDIKSIVTKEQFEQMSYKVGD